MEKWWKIMQSKLPKASRTVLKALMDANKPLKTNELVHELRFNLRTVRYALKSLCDSQYVDRIPDLSDLRSYYYTPSKRADYNLI